MVRFCNQVTCQHYGELTGKYKRKCYYEPNCWRGHLDKLLALTLLKLRIR